MHAQSYTVARPANKSFIVMSAMLALYCSTYSKFFKYRALLKILLIEQTLVIQTALNAYQ